MSRKFYETMVKWLKCYKDLRQSKADTCVFAKKNLIVGIYVDDLLITGVENEVKMFVREMKKEFDITYKEQVSMFLGMEFEHQNSNSILLRQASMIDKMTNKFKSEITNLQSYQTPAAQGFITNVPSSTDVILTPMDQEKYHSGVGSLLYLTKKLHVLTSKTLQENCRKLYIQQQRDYKVLLRVIKYLESTRTAGLVVNPSRSRNGEDELLAYVNSDWAGDIYSRKRIRMDIVP